VSDGQYDIAILGGGPGGYVAALYAGAKGARVALVERDRVGGTCVLVGCIPKVALADSGAAFRLVREGEAFGVKVGDAGFDMGSAVGRKNKVVDQLVGGIETLLKARKVELIKGEGTLRGPGGLAVKTRDGARDVRARGVIVATGSFGPLMPPIPGLKDAKPLDNVTAMQLQRVPKRVVIIGAGVIGMEFASFFGEVGAQVTVLELLPNAMVQIDPELTRAAVRVLEKKGVKLVTAAKITEVVAGGGKKGHQLKAEIGGKLETFEADEIMVATGRGPLLEAVKDAGLRTSKRGIETDERMRTNLPDVYAIGDCVGMFQLAHVASTEGEVAVDNILGDDRLMDYGATPQVVYTHPEIAQVGLSEAQAKEKHGDAVKVARFRFGASGRALALGETDGLVKLVTVGPERLIVGVQIVGPEASELIAEATLAIRLEATAADLAVTMHAHPTLAETLREAALVALGTGVHTAA
jgi:dihydrolipoamide dehydrogenase